MLAASLASRSRTSCLICQNETQARVLTIQHIYKETQVKLSPQSVSGDIERQDYSNVNPTEDGREDWESIEERFQADIRLENGKCHRVRRYTGKAHAIR